MAVNSGNGSRIGVVKNRKQTYNTTTKKYVKRNTETGKIMACSDEPFKNIRRDDKAKKAETKAKTTDKSEDKPANKSAAKSTAKPKITSKSKVTVKSKATAKSAPAKGGAKGGAKSGAKK